MNKFFGAILHTPKTIHALIVNGVHHLVRVHVPLVIDSVYTLLFHANGTLQASLFPGNHTGLGNGLKPMGNRSGMDHIFRRHLEMIYSITMF
jgi:hypothetical protein